MKTVARIAVGVFAGVPAGVAMGTLAAALIVALISGAEAIRAADGTLDAIAAFFVAGPMLAVIVAPTTLVAGGFGGIIGPFSSNHRGLFLASAVLVGMSIGLLRLLPYLEIYGNLRPDLLEVLGHPTAGAISGLTSVIV